jgi:nitrogen fixation/metabolism regulation signal transduction histidine kinase
MRWQAWQACAAHYQPLLEAKDAEIKNWRDIFNGMSDELADAKKENTTLKALLEQAREGLERLLRPTINLTDEQSARDIIAAINAATGEK